MNDELVDFIAGAEHNGLDMDHAVTAHGVVFRSEKTALTFSKLHGKDVAALGDRWLAKDRPTST